MYPNYNNTQNNMPYNQNINQPYIQQPGQAGQYAANNNASPPQYSGVKQTLGKKAIINTLLCVFFYMLSEYIITVIFNWGSSMWVMYHVVLGASKIISVIWAVALIVMANMANKHQYYFLPCIAIGVNLCLVFYVVMDFIDVFVVMALSM